MCSTFLLRVRAVGRRAEREKLWACFVAAVPSRVPRFVLSLFDIFPRTSAVNVLACEYLAPMLLFWHAVTLFRSCSLSTHKIRTPLHFRGCVTNAGC